jgi:hypothetical protein
VAKLKVDVSDRVNEALHAMAGAADVTPDAIVNSALASFFGLATSEQGEVVDEEVFVGDE